MTLPGTLEKPYTDDQREYLRRQAREIRASLPRYIARGLPDEATHWERVAHGLDEAATLGVDPAELAKADICAALVARGFSVEMVGGGCELLSLYLPRGVAIWASYSDGPGMPENSDWLICVYEPDGDSMSEARLYIGSDCAETLPEHWPAALAAALAFAADLDKRQDETPAA